MAEMKLQPKVDKKISYRLVITNVPQEVKTMYDELGKIIISKDGKKYTPDMNAFLCETIREQYNAIKSKEGN